MKTGTLVTIVSGAALLLSGMALAPSAHAGGPGVEFHKVPLGCAMVPPVPEFGPNCNEITGYATLKVGPNDSFKVQFVADGLYPGHAVTLWAFDSTFAGGFLAGGIVGGSGKINLAGNNCVYSMADDQGNVAVDAGFAPGGDRRCDLIDLSVSGAFPPGMSLWLIDHGVWTPGDMAARWTWEGIPGANTAALFILD